MFFDYFFSQEILMTLCIVGLAMELLFCLFLLGVFYKAYDAIFQHCF